MKQFMVLMLFTTPVVAQDELEQAMGYTFANVVVLDETFRGDLTDAQRERIRLLHDIYHKEYNDYVNQTLVIEGGDTVGLFGKVVDNRQTPEDIAHLRQMEAEFDVQLRSELIPDQINAAEKRVLQRRYETAGLLGIASSSDLQLVKHLPLADIRQTLTASSQEADKEIQALYVELNKIIEEFRRKVDAIRQKHDEQALQRLGPAGAELLKLIE